MEILLRVIHILGGAFWVGAVLVTVFFLFTVVTDLGPVGGQFMGAMVKRGYMTWVPIAAVLTVLSGIDLLRRTSNGFDPVFMGSRMGMALSVGGLAAIIALLLGLLIGRPATMKVGAIMATAGPMADGPGKQALMAEAGKLRERGTITMYIVCTLVVFATLCMAAARYL